MHLINLLRIHQWSKNLLLFIPLILSQNYDINFFIETFIGFLSFSLIASSGYIVNDIIDYNFDKNDPERKKRLIASGSISFYNAIIVFLILFVLSLLISFIYLDLNFIILSIIYLVTVILYSYFLKKIIIIDFIILTMFFVFRLIIGADITETPISSWLLFFSLFIFLFLALNKRIVEIQKLSSSNNNFYNNYNRGYEVKDLNLLKSLSIASGLISIFVLSIYFNFSDNYNYYENIYFSFSICLLLLIWVIRILFITQRGQMNYDPIIFSLNDKVSWIIIVLIFFIFLFNH